MKGALEFRDRFGVAVLEVIGDGETLADQREVWLNLQNRFILAAGGEIVLPLFVFARGIQTTVDIRFCAAAKCV